MYRNIVKALPWFTSVREKLTDPAYSGWFLKFDPAVKAKGGKYHVPDCAAENSSKCSVYYHDQGQTPEVHGGDGTCTDGTCECGEGVPCGEYLFDHRNGSSLRDWIVEQHIGGPKGLGSPDVDGLFMDDYW